MADQIEKYWKKQSSLKPIFPDFLWNKPERKTGRIAIIGGNSRGFSSVVAAYSTALKFPVENVKIILPDSLKKQIPSNILDVIFAKSGPSGGFSNEALPELNAAESYSNSAILIGDSGANAETSALFTKFIREKTSLITITRDAVDLISNSAEEILTKPNIHLVLGISQLQKLSRKVYYPRVITLTASPIQLAETLHKFTLTYPAKISLWHAGQLFFATNGQVFSMDFDQPMRVWSGEIAVRESIWTTWISPENLERDFAKSVISSWLEL